MGMRKMARSIVAARADKQALAAGDRVGAPGKFRKFAFALDWDKACHSCARKAGKRSWGLTKRREVGKLEALASKLGVSL